MAVTDELWLAYREKEVGNELKMKEMGAMGLQRRVQSERSTALIVSRCAVGLRLKVWPYCILKKTRE